MSVPRWPAVSLLAIAAVTLPAGAWAAACTRDSAVTSQLVRVAQDEGVEIVQTVSQIQGVGRRLLALRSYLRNRDLRQERWSWTAAQIDEYRNSREYRDLMQEIDRIRVRFESANPGFELYVNTEVRSLDLQIQRWNENESVGRLASSLEAALCKRFGTHDAGNLPPEILRQALLAWQPAAPPPLAAPGLSLHGRARAVDFQVHRGTQVIAGPEIAKIADTWVAEGWADRLSAIVAATSTRFKGPLKVPNEPWHYEYQP